MQKELVILFTIAGMMLFVHRPLTKNELNTLRMRLETKIEAVDKKIDKLSQQVQNLNRKIDQLNQKFTTLEEYLGLDSYSCFHLEKIGEGRPYIMGD